MHFLIQHIYFQVNTFILKCAALPDLASSHTGRSILLDLMRRELLCNIMNILLRVWTDQYLHWIFLVDMLAEACGLCCLIGWGDLE